MAYGYTTSYFSSPSTTLRAAALISSWLKAQFGLDGSEAWTPGRTFFSAFGENFLFEVRRRRTSSFGMARADWTLSLRTAAASPCVLHFHTASLLGSSSFSAFYSADLSLPGAEVFLKAYYRFTREFALGSAFSGTLFAPDTEHFEVPLLPAKPLLLLEKQEKPAYVIYLEALKRDSERRALALSMEILEGVRRARARPEPFLPREVTKALAPAKLRKSAPPPLTDEEKIELAKKEAASRLLRSLSADGTFEWAKPGASAAPDQPRLNRKMRRALEKRKGTSPSAAVEKMENALPTAALSSEETFIPDAETFEDPSLVKLREKAEALFADAREDAREARLMRLALHREDEAEAREKREALAEKKRAAELRRKAAAEAQTKEEAEFADRLEEIRREAEERQRLQAEVEAGRLTAEHERERADPRREALEKNLARSEARRLETLARKEEVLRRRALAKPQETHADDAAEGTAEPTQLSAKLEADTPLSERLRTLSTAMDSAIAEASALEAEIELLREQVLREEARTERWRNAYEEASKTRPTPAGEAFRSITAKLVTRPNWEPTVEECLAYVEAFRPDRVTILDSAWESARESASFLMGRRLLSLLMRLVTEAVDQRAQGGDRRLASVFSTREYSPRETQETLAARDYAKRRTFRYMGEALLMEQHLRIGNSRDRGRCLRIYFDFAKKDGRVLIGWCGRHLPCLSS